jgi:hypothetical protein
LDEPLYETDLFAMKFPNSMKLLLDPNVGIDDTATTAHATQNPSVADADEDTLETPKYAKDSSSDE